MESYVAESQAPETIMYANSAAVSVGELIHVAGIGVLRAMVAGDADESICYMKKGLLSNVPITSAVTVAQGNACYWDVSENKIILTGMAEGDFFLGFATQAGSAAGGYVEVEISNLANFPSALGNISVHDASGKFKASYATIDLAVAGLVANDILIIKSGAYTLTSALNITKPGVKIIGEGSVEITGFAGADYCFKTVLGALTATAEITFKNLNIIHTDDASQVGIQVDNTSATKKLNVYVDDCTFETDGGNSIDIDHADTSNAVRVYGNRCTVEGPVNMVTADNGDRMRFDVCTLRGGVVTDAGNFDLEMLFKDSIILHGGISGGHSNQRCIFVNCVSETDADPNVYALVDGDDNVGSATDQIIGS
jgi:hypothetical protein